jgi:FAD:protein FMN transferase
MRHCSLISVAGIVTLALLVTVGQWRIAVQQHSLPVTVIHHTHGVMGTDCAMAVVTVQARAESAKAALDEAESTLRRLEAAMSAWLDDSEVARFHDAPVDAEVPLSPDTLAVLIEARDAYERTDRTFDVTCRPQMDLWRRASQQNEVPSPEQLAAARSASCWNGIQLTSTGIIKLRPDVRLDLGGIAKGYAIDRALGILQDAGFQGGLVDVGGDLACFGAQLGDQPWLVDVRDPDVPGSLIRLQIVDRAVATSGDYARRIQIADRRYSHIIDPREGRPTEATRSVTVVAPTAIAADVWATALSILGSEGLGRLPQEVEALIVTDTEVQRRVVSTPGFRDLLTSSPPADWESWPDAGEDDVEDPQRLATSYDQAPR